MLLRTENAGRDTYETSFVDSSPRKPQLEERGAATIVGSWDTFLRIFSDFPPSFLPLRGFPRLLRHFLGENVSVSIGRMTMNGVRNYNTAPPYESHSAGCASLLS